MLCHCEFSKPLLTSVGFFTKINLKEIPPLPVNSISPNLSNLPTIDCLVDIVSMASFFNSSVSLLLIPL